MSVIESNTSPHEVVQKFLRLPFRRQFAIAEKLGVLPQGWEEMANEELLRHVFQKVASEKLHSSFWAEVQQHYIPHMHSLWVGEQYPEVPMYEPCETSNKVRTSRVVKVDRALIFNDGHRLESKHRKSCCEQHYLSFRDLSLDDFEGLEFDLSGDTFFRRVPGYGIELLPVSGWGVKIPGYSNNNGYYSTNLTLVLRHPVRDTVKWDITECQ